MLKLWDGKVELCNKGNIILDLLVLELVNVCKHYWMIFLRY